MTRNGLLITPILFAGIACTATSQSDDPQLDARRRRPVPATTAPANREGHQTGPAAAEKTEASEQGILENHVQLTFADQYLKAGESYFSPDDRRVVFQAIEVPRDGEEPEQFYQMYVADFVRSAAGRITGIENTRRLSPPGSSNTCGWFSPTDPNVVVFASTIDPPTAAGASGYQREGSRYAWQFPSEMTIVRCDFTKADGTKSMLEPIVVDPAAYLAEGSLSPDGRYLVYCSRAMSDGQLGGDLRTLDLTTGEDVLVAGHSGYDGGPFFSPDGRRICYRSDRAGNDLLQVFVGELAMDDTGRITGLSREFQLTRNEHVNWAPFWHPNGRYLVYATSEQGHRNYEVYIIDADAGSEDNADAPACYGTSKRRVTHAAGFDGLPVFNRDGSLMMWTGQRDAERSSQLWLADFVMPLD